MTVTPPSASSVPGPKNFVLLGCALSAEPRELLVFLVLEMGETSLISWPDAQRATRQ